MAKAGDRVWLLKQGDAPRGIFGRGEITGRPVRGRTSNGKQQWMAPVRFGAFVDPRQGMLIGEDAVARVLKNTQINAPASGYPLDDSQSEQFDRLLGSDRLGAEAAEVRQGGSDWTQSELNAIVGDYFAMLVDELAGRPYSKTEHRNELRKTVNRSDGSIERKHQNISAVLQELGLPWINGYKPLGNFQRALLDAVDAVLSRGGADALDQTPAQISAPNIDVQSVFVAPPQIKPKPSGRELIRLVNKFDAAVRDAANRSLGRAGEEFVLRVEVDRLVVAGRRDLAQQVAWVSSKIGDGLGYDIESFSEDGSKIFIEVKTTKGPINTPFYISENERWIAAEKKAAFRLYRVFSFSKSPQIYRLPGPVDEQLALEPISYRARVIASR